MNIVTEALPVKSPSPLMGWIESSCTTMNMYYRCVVENMRHPHGQIKIDCLNILANGYSQVST